MKKLFIVIEGIDGAGTSTQAGLLRDYLVANSLRATVTSEPSSGPIGNLIREGLKKRVVFTEDPRKFDLQMAFLFAADRFDHLHNEVDGVLKLLKQGLHVISTRYYFSSLAYHSHSDSEFDFVMRLNETFPDPQLVIYLDASVDVSLSRMSSRSFADAYENGEKLTVVRKNYEKIFSKYQGPLLRVNGDAPVGEVHKAIVNRVSEMLYE